MSDIDSLDSDRGNPLTDSLADWLVDQALRDRPIDKIFEGTCKQLSAGGIPVARGHVTFRVLHPLHTAQSLSWRRDRGVEERSYLHSANQEPWETSPLNYMVVNDLPYLRRRLVGESAMLDFDLLNELCAEGFTDYLGFKIQFNDAKDNMELANGILGSWCTDRENGFTNSDIRSLKRVEQRLAVAFKINIQSKITENILSAYLGPGAGRKVLDGQIKRGDGETIHAVIWYSDMRDSTRLAETMTGQEFLQALNAYFECTAGAVMHHGGEVLRFIGDAVLGIFQIPADGDAEHACRAAMDAARMAQHSLSAVNSDRRGRGEEALDFGLGLHVGEVLFGNIGVPQRVEFSVIGPAANEVARLESLTKALKRQILVSEVFAGKMKVDWDCAGRHVLRGVDQPVTVYAPPATS